MVRALTLSLLTVVLCLLGPGFSDAEEKSYPGTFCVGEGSPGDSGISYYAGNHAENVRPDAEHIYCPIVRMNQNAPLSWVRIYIHDNHAGDSVDCELYHKDVTGVPFAGSGTQSSGAAFIGNTSFLLWGPSVNYVGGHYVVQCSLPPRVSGRSGGSIQSYVVSELPQ
jgi:hypothetical protein